MTNTRTVPSEEARKQSLKGLREANHQLDLLNLQLDELIAMIETELRKQKKERLLNRGQKAEKNL